MSLLSFNPPLSRRENYKWWVLGAIVVGTLLTVIDLSSLNVALPTIGAHFDADLSRVQWVVLVNSLTITALVLPMGRLSDMLGRKELYVAGFSIFILGAIVGALAVSLPMLIAARGIQGLGAAMVQANFTAMAVSVFPATERGKVMGLIMSTVGTGGIIGPGIGGALVSAFGWRSIFIGNALIGLGAIASAAVIIDKRSFAQDLAAGRRLAFDWTGAITSACVLLLFLLTVTFGYRVGWLDPRIVGGVILLGISLAVFVWWELRTESPMFDFRMFKRKLVFLGSAAALVSFLGTGSVLFLMPFYLQNVQGYTPGQVGLIMIPSSLCMALMAPLSGRLSDRFGWRWFTVGGMAVSITAMFVFALTLSPTSPLGLIIPALMLRFTGHALFNSPNNNSIFSAVERSRYGVVSALTQVLRNGGTVAGIAIMTTIIVTTMGGMGYEPRLEAVTAAGGEGVAAAFVTGVQRCFLVLGGLFVLALIFSLFKGSKMEEHESSHPRGRLRQAAQAAD